MVKLRESIEPAKAAPSASTSQSGSGELGKDHAETSFNIREEIKLLIEIQDILDELDILKMVRIRVL